MKSEDLDLSPDFIPYKITMSWFLPLSKGSDLPHKIVIKIKWDNTCESAIRLANLSIKWNAFTVITISKFDHVI